MSGGGSPPPADQSTKYTDNRKVYGPGALVAEGDGSSVSQTVNVLDGGAIGTAFDFAGATVDKAFDFGTDALASNNRAVASSLNFADDTVNAAFAANQRAIQASLNAQSDALAFAQSANAQAQQNQRYAIDTAAGSMADALAYSGKQTAVALDSLNGSANLVKDAYADAKGRGALTDKILMVAIGMAGLVAWSAVKR